MVQKSTHQKEKKIKKKKKAVNLWQDGKLATRTHGRIGFMQEKVFP
jgi:hypothetical protein